MKIRMKIEVFANWVQRWKFLITLFLGAFIGWVFYAITEIIPENYKIYTIALFIGTILSFAIVLAVADIFYKYREVQTARSFFNPFTLQKWENKVTILNEDGSAEVQTIRVITAEEGVEIPSIKLGFWSDSAGNDIKPTCTKVNGKEVDINPKNITMETITQDDQIKHKNLTINVPTLNKVSPSVELICDLDYPPGAFKEAFDNKEDDEFGIRIYHPTRLLKINLELKGNLAKEGYKFDQPSFEVQDFNGNKVGRVEEAIKREKAYPEFNSKNLSWEITNPKVGLAYILKFKIFKPETLT